MTLLALAGLVLLLAHTVRGAIGFGSALIAIPGLVLAFGPARAMFYVSVLDAVGGLLLLRDQRRAVSWPFVGLLLVPLLLGQVGGLAMGDLLPDRAIRAGLGALVLLYGVSLLLQPVRAGHGQLAAAPRHVGVLTACGVGALASGVLSGLTGIPGPPVVVVVRRFFADGFFRTQLLAFFTIAATSLAMMLYARGDVGPQDLPALGALLPPMLAGAVTGRSLSGRLAPSTFGRFVGLVLGGAGGSLVLSSLG